MTEITDLKPLQDAFGSAKSILVVMPATANLDGVAAGLGLVLAIRDSGKGAVVASGSQLRVEHSRLVGVDQVSQKLGNRNLVISFDYIQDAIEKVSYNVEGSKFNLVIQPKEGARPLDPASVSYSYEGSDAEVVLVVGAKNLAELGNLYLTEKGVFDKAMVVNIDNQPGNSQYGQVNFVDDSCPSLSQLAVRLIQALGLRLSAEASGNLMQGLEVATQDFGHPGVGAETFEVAALLLRSGASRTLGTPQEKVVAGVNSPQVLQQLKPQGLGVTDSVPSADWLKPPKIYKGSTRV